MKSNESDKTQKDKAKAQSVQMLSREPGKKSRESQAVVGNH